MKRNPRSKRTRRTKAKQLQEKGYTCVGQFLARFAIIESAINEILLTLLNLHTNLPHAALVVTGALDLRKKIKIVERGAKLQRLDLKKALDHVQKLHDIRNVLAHSSFMATEHDIYFDYVNAHGQMRFPGQSNDDTSLTYKELRAYDKEMAAIAGKLINATAVPFEEFDEEFQRNIEIALSEPNGTIH